MKLIAALLFAVLTLGGGVYFLSHPELLKKPVPGVYRVSPTPEVKTVLPTENPHGITTIGEQLDTPWAIAFLPDRSFLVTERPGRLRLVGVDGKLLSDPIATLDQVKEIGEGGLLGLALHPNFGENHFIYLYYTYSDAGDRAMNRVSRFTFERNQLSNEQIIIDQIPGSSNHDGGRIKFGPDGLLYVGTGDAEQPSEAQNTRSLAGKILRVTDEGRIPADNPFHNEVYSYGHRNVQGLAWDSRGDLWATEHGRSGAATGYDELNRIEKGKNYGWPTIQGDESRSGMVTSIRNSGPTTTWAPSGTTFLNGSVYFAGLKGKTLYQAVLSGTTVTDFREHLVGEFGRLREVVIGPDNMIYITTSNRDGRGVPNSLDDRIIRVNPGKL